MYINPSCDACTIPQAKRIFHNLRNIFSIFFSIFEKLVLLEILQINLYTEKTQRSSIQTKWEWILPFQIGKG
ncbi:hypothetical protein P8452_33387 [Trifolium repens]|nr:hypothetical protein P8452_33387 [Trifolium repens]